MRPIRLFLFVLLAWSVISRPTFAAAEPEAEISDGYKAGYSTKPSFGGPNSPEAMMEEDDRIKEPAFRFEGIHDAFKPWREWKRRQNKEHGFRISGHYASLFQGANKSMTGEDKASSGIFRVNTIWTLLGRGTKDTGSLALTVDNRHAYQNIAPAGLASEVGYAGVTGTLFSDIDWAVVNLNWQQGFNDGHTGLLVGRFDPSDYMNILGYTNPWVTFTNVAIMLDPSVSFADTSWGVGGGHWLNDQFYLSGGMSDANGALTDNLEFFDGGSELYTWANAGWSPSMAQRYSHNVHAITWHVDGREDLGTESAQGVALAANWTFDDKWMPFLRAGWSEGSTPIYNKSATIGLRRTFKYRSDTAGIGFNWGELSGDLGEQTTVEAFWNIQFAQNLAITPSVQYLGDPALNPEDDNIWIASLRMRLTY